MSNLERYLSLKKHKCTHHPKVATRLDKEIDIFFQGIEWINTELLNNISDPTRIGTKTTHIHTKADRHYKAFLAASVKRSPESIPSWYDAPTVCSIVLDAKVQGLAVHHVVPLKGIIKGQHVVCGLTVQDNLQPVHSRVNNFHGCSAWPDMWEYM